MSHWTHVTLSVEVSWTEQNSPEALKAQVLETAKQSFGGVEGSEGPVDIFVEPLHVSSTSLGPHCPKYCWGDALVIVHGHLRDQEIAETKEALEWGIESLRGDAHSLRNLYYAIWGNGDEPPVSFTQFDEEVVK